MGIVGIVLTENGGRARLGRGRNRQERGNERWSKQFQKSSQWIDHFEPARLSHARSREAEFYQEPSVESLAVPSGPSQRLDARQRLALQPFQERAAGGRDVAEVIGNAGMAQRRDRIASAGNRQQFSFAR